MSLYDLSATLNDGKEKKLSAYKGKVLLIVNTASKCGFTPQYQGLQELYGKYKDRGFELLAFPCDQFGHQEPGSDADIKSFCETKFGVEFPMFEKIVVKGEMQHPLYRELIAECPTAQQNPKGTLRKTLDQHGLGPANDTDIMWNFEKFLVNRQGQVVGRFAPDFTPKDPAITTAIETELNKSA